MDADEVTVRAGPNALSPKVGTLKPGDQVEVLGKLENRQWIEVAFPAAPNGTAWLFSGLISMDGTDVPIVASDGSLTTTSTPNAAMTTPIDPKVTEAIQKFSQKKGLNIVYLGRTDFIAMGPELVKTVDRYSVGDVYYDIDPISNRVIAYHNYIAPPVGSSTYSADELEKMAQQLVMTQIPGIQPQTLSFERNNKIDNFFFRRSKSATGPGYMICVQVGFTVAGQLFDYVDSLPANIVFK